MPTAKDNRTKRSTKDEVPTIGSPPRKILIAVTGMSPAVLTETIWALAKESPPVIPDEVIVLTTAAGQTAIKDQLFGPDRIWDELRNFIIGDHDDSRLVFCPQPSNVKVFTCITHGKRVPLKNIDSLEHNNAVGDCILDELWAHTEKPDTRLIISIAGGYKSMSALMMSCLSLLGRPDDRVTHVLISPPFEESGLGFYFPSQPRQFLQTRGGHKVLASKASICLFDVPWVPFRVLFEKELKTKPASYSGFVSKLRGAVPDSNQEPKYRWDASSKHGIITLGTVQYFLKNKQSPFFEFLLEHAQTGADPFPDHYLAKAALEEFLETPYAGKDAIRWSKANLDHDQIRKVKEEVNKAAPGILLTTKGVVGLRWRQG